MRRPRRKPARLGPALRRMLLAFLGASLLPVLLYRWVDPPVTLLMLHRKVQAVWEGAPDTRIRYRWTDYGEVSPHFLLAVVACEDQKFPQHHGFDLDAIADAVNDAEDGGRLRGASTISQQVARNVFLWPGRSWVRKGLEAWFTVLIETLWSKRRILEVYVNVAEMGPRLFGVGAASRHYFGTAPSRLNPQQAALLAATLPNPLRRSASAPTAAMRARQRWTLGQMRNLGGITYLAHL